jgi:hypothetical protein
MKYFIIVLLIFLNAQLLFANTDIETKLNEADAKNVKIKYKDAGRIDFESLLIEGERKKPEMSVVTGNIGEKDNGLMIFRENFEDMMANDFGEVIE